MQTLLIKIRWVGATSYLYFVPYITSHIFFLLETMPLQERKKNWISRNVIVSVWKLQCPSLSPISATRPNLSQFYSLRTRPSNFLSPIQLMDWRVLRLQNCRMLGRVWSWTSFFHSRLSTEPFLGPHFFSSPINETHKPLLQSLPSILLNSEDIKK